MNLKSIRREFDKLTIVQLFIALFILIFFLVTPIASLLVRAFISDEGFSFKYFEITYSDPNMISPTPSLTVIQILERYKFETLPNGTRILIPLKTIYIGGVGPNFGYILNSIFVSATVMILALSLIHI